MIKKTFHAKFRPGLSTTRFASHVITTLDQFHLLELSVQVAKALVHATAIQVRRLNLTCGITFSPGFIFLLLSLGGGFFVKLGESWTLRGIVSATILKGSFDCDVDRYAIYTKVVEFYDWIQNFLIINV